MRAYTIGQRVTYKVNDFDGAFKSECEIIEVGEDYAIAVEVNEPNPMRLYIDADTEYQFVA